MPPRLALRLFCLYAASGVPLGLVLDAVPVQLRHDGVGLAVIGWVTGLAQLPWSLKPLWAPWVDRLGSLRGWMAAALAAAAAVTVVLAGLTPVTPAWRLAAMLAALAGAAATFDLAIDARFIRAVPHALLGPANGIRVAAYRLGMVGGGGLVVYLASRTGWAVTVTGLAVLFIVGAMAAARIDEPPAAPPATFASWAQGLWRWLDAPGGTGTLAFLLFFRLGDAMLAAMARPFWVDRGLSPAAIGAASGALGIGLTVVGALIGGAFTARFGILVGLAVLGSLQAASNLGYVAVAGWDLSTTWLLVAIAVESLCQGLGTAAQLALTTRLCDPSHAATQFAVLTALAGLTRVVAGSASGELAAGAGFATCFAVAFVAALPALAFLPLVRRRLRAA